jgi:anti-sigma regulatory factor (Ser/Thr protein kinase)
VPFLRDGVGSGDRVVAVCGIDHEVLLRGALGPAAGSVEFAESATWYSHPARTLADCLSDADDTAWRGRRLRLLGEPVVWASRPPLEVLEWQRAEAMLNVAFRGTGAAVMCPYASSLPAGVVAAGRRTHPETVRGATSMANPLYMDPWAYSAQCDGEPLPAPPGDADTLPIVQPDLYWLRTYVADYARGTPLPEEDLQRLLVAVTEVVTNALRHGEPPITLRMWTETSGADPALVCEVTDQGHWASGSGYGLVPPRPSCATAAGGFGLWAVRLLCSIVQIRTGRGGSTVRLRLRLPAVRPRPAPAEANGAR